MTVRPMPSRPIAPCTDDGDARVRPQGPGARRSSRARTACAALALALLAACASIGGTPPAAADSVPIRAGDPQRGQALYENRCGECHSQSVHNRTARAARDFTGVLDQVRRWDRNLGARWTDEDIRDVTVYLNMTFYKYPCPAPACSAARTQALPPGPLAGAGERTPPPR